MPSASNELRNRYTAARSIDLKGRTVLPGFFDTHIHLGGHSRRYIDFRETKSLAELQQQVREKAKELAPGEWITGGDWNEYHFAEKRKPVRGDLDAAAPNNPVVLTRAGAHSAVGNSKALGMADINKATPDPDRGIIEKDAERQPNGVIRERIDLYTRLVPADKPQEVRESLFEDVREQLKLGITSVIEAGATIEPEVVGSYAEWELLYEKHGAELPRASIQIAYPSEAGNAKAGAAKLKEWGRKTGDGNERLRVGSIGEMFADGGFTGPTAWSLVDYKGQPGFRGRAFFTPEQIHANIEEGHKLGWQFGIHAIGDAAIAMTVDASTVLQDYPRKDHRHYLCHFTVLPPERTLATDGERQDPHRAAAELHLQPWKGATSKLWRATVWPLTMPSARPSGTASTWRSAATIFRSDPWSDSMPPSPAKAKAAKCTGLTKR